MKNIFTRFVMNGPTWLKTVGIGLVLMVVTLSLSAGTANDWHNAVTPFVRTLLSVDPDLHPNLINGSVASVEGNTAAPVKLLAPCDVMADTIRITRNAGGIPPDAAGREWTPYTAYNLPGRPYGNGAATSTPGSNGTSSPALYARGLFGQTLDMNIPVPNGDYTVIQHFSTNANAIGGRLFDVSLENTKVETDLDVFVESGGQYMALAKSYAVTVDGKDLTILMVYPETSNAIIQGIEIIPTSTPFLQRSVAMELDVTGCYYVNGESRATVNARIIWDNVITGDQITISLGGVSRTITPGMIQVNYEGVFFGQQSIIAPQYIAFEVPADGAMGTVTATFNSDATCVTSANFTAPGACEPTTCAGGADVVGGYAFIDNNQDGTEQPGEILREAGVAVRIYGSDAAGTSILTGSAMTDAFGNYSFSGLTDGERYRVEFDFPGGGGLDQTVNGGSNRTYFKKLKDHHGEQATVLSYRQ